MNDKGEDIMDDDALLRLRDHNALDASLWNDKCDYTELDECNNLNPNNYNLIVMHLNIRSVLCHQQELCQLIRSTEKKNSRIDVILLCETFLSSKTKSMVNIPGFSHICNYRKSKKGGGISILLHEGIPYKCRSNLDIFKEGLTESVFAEIRSKNGKQIIIGSMYKPLNVNIDQYSNNLSTIVNKIRSATGGLTPEIIIGMDHNINLLNSATHLPTHNFMETLSNLNLHPTITRPTRITHHSATLIDNIFISELLHRNFESSILIEDISNHLPLLTMLKQTRLLNSEPLEFNSRCLNDEKLKHVNNILMNVDWIGLLTGTTSNQKFNQFSDKVDSVLDQVAPIKKVKISTKKRFIEPWMTRSLALASEKKLKLYKKTLSATCTEYEIKAYKSYCNTYNALKRKLRSDYYRMKCTEFQRNAWKLWSLINNTIKKVKNRGSIIPYITVNGLRQYNPIKIANGFGDFYASLRHNLASKIIPGTTSLSTYLDTIPRSVNSMIVQPTTVPEIDTLIKQLPNKTSYGHEKISNIMLKALRTSITYPLCHIFNASLSEGTFPDRMKIAEVIPLYKGKDIDSMINYRPISLLIMLSKLLEKIMYTGLYRYLETQNLLYPSQYGFRTKRSCEQAIMELVGNILQSKNRNEHCASVFLDLSKAFDTLDHTILLQKLERYGIRGIVLEWFGNYLKDRSLVAKITTGPNLTVKSESYKITYGAAQGSCLGPLLFIIFMNDIHLLPVYSSIILFADDTTIFNSHKSAKFLKYMLEHDLMLMMDWFKANALSLNLDKTVGMKFWDSSNSFTLKVDDMPISMTNCVKFLGLYIDKNLTWQTHLSHLIEKLQKTGGCYH